MTKRGLTVSRLFSNACLQEYNSNDVTKAFQGIIRHSQIMSPLNSHLENEQDIFKYKHSYFSFIVLYKIN